MKRILFLSLLLLSLVACQASANLIGLFADMDGTLCSADFALYANTDVRVIAHLTTITAGITAAEFRIDGVGVTAGNAIVSAVWQTPLVIGDALTPQGVALAWTEPYLPGEGTSFIFLGTYQFFTIAGGWPTADSVWCIAETIPDEGAGDPKLVLVDDSFEEIPADGWCFIAHCTSGCLCTTIPTEESSWGQIKAMY